MGCMCGFITIAFKWHCLNLSSQLCTISFLPCLSNFRSFVWRWDRGYSYPAVPWALLCSFIPPWPSVSRECSPCFLPHRFFFITWGCKHWWFLVLIKNNSVIISKDLNTPYSTCSFRTNISGPHPPCDVSSPVVTLLPIHFTTLRKNSVETKNVSWNCGLGKFCGKCGYSTPLLVLIWAQHLCFVYLHWMTLRTSIFVFRKEILISWE